VDQNGPQQRHRVCQKRFQFALADNSLQKLRKWAVLIAFPDIEGWDCKLELGRPEFGSLITAWSECVEN
jgi:hypothetical protein